MMDSSSFSPSVQSSVAREALEETLPTSTSLSTDSQHKDEVFYLILKYLNSFDALKDSASNLEANLKSIGAFGSITGWDGSQRSATVSDYEKKYPMIPNSQLLLLLHQNGNSATASKSTSSEFHDAKPSLLRRVVGYYNTNVPEEREKFTSLSKELSHLLGRLRQNLEAISTSEHSRARILKRIESGFENDDFNLDTVDLTSNSPQNQVVTDLKEIGGKKDVHRLERLIHDSKLEVNRIKDNILKVIERLRVGGFLGNVFDKGHVDNGLEWMLCRSLGFMNLRSCNAVGAGRTFLSSTHKLSNNFLTNYKLHYTISGHMMNPAYCCVFDQTGNYLLTGADDYLVKIWDVNKGQLVRTCRGHMTYISLIAVSPDNSIFASACVGGSIRVWRMSDGLCLQVLQHQATVNWLKFDPSSCTLASCGDDGLCIVWDLSKLLAPDNTAIPLMDKILLRKAKYLSRFNPNIAAVSPKPASTSGRRYDDAETEMTEDAAVVYRPFVGMFDWSRDEEVLALPSTNSSSSSSAPPPSQSSPNLALPHIRDTNVLHAPGDSLKVLCLDVSNLGNVLVTGCEDGVARIWKFGNPEVNELSDAKYPTRTQKRPMELQLPKLKGMLSHDDYSRIEKVAKHLLLRLEGHVSPITDIQFNSLGDRIVTGSSKDGSVRIWSLSRDYTESIHIVLDLGEEDEAVTNVMQSRMKGRSVRSGSRIQVHNVCWTCDDLRIVTIQSVPCKNGNVNEENLPTRLKVWDSMTGDLLRIIRNVSDMAGKCLSRHPLNPSVIVTGGQDGYLNVWNIDTESSMSKHYVAGEEGKPANIVDISVSADGTRIAATDHMGRLTVAGLDDPNKYNKVYKEQYFSSDYSDIILDEHGFAVDVGTQLLADRAPVGQLTRIDGSAYEVQLRAISGPSPLSESAVDGLLQQLDDSRGKLDAEVDRVFSTFNRYKRLGRMPKKYSDVRSEDKAGFHSTPQRAKTVTASSRIRYIEYDEMTTSSDSEVDSVTGERRSYNYRSRQQHNSGNNNRNSGNNRSSRPSRGGEAPRRSGIMTFSELNRRDNVRRSNRPRSQIPTYNDELEEEDFILRNSSSRAGRAAARASRYGPSSSRSRHDDSSASGGSSEQDEEESLVLESDSDDNIQAKPKSKRGRKPRSTYSSEADDQMETEHVAKAISKSKAQQPKKRRAGPEGLDEIGLELDRHWLQWDVSRDYLYSPQLGDVVIYLPQGHREHLSEIAETSSPPWLAFPQKWPLVECQVRDISFEFPTPQEFRKCKSAIAVITLMMLRVPTKHTIQSNGYCFVDLAEPRATRHNSMKEYCFQVKLRNLGLADFIIPSKLFQRSICLPWYEGIRISVKFREPEGQDVFNDYHGKVVRLSNSDAEWPHSPWEALEVVWDDATVASSSSAEPVNNAPQVHRISPWDAVPQFDSESQFTSVLEKFKSPSIPAEEASRMDHDIGALMDKEYEKFSPFEFEVDSTIFPNYYSATVLPVYIDLIRRRLQNGYYRQLEALEWDINKLYANCEYYNQAGSEIVQTAAELRDALLSIVQKSPLYHTASSSSSSSSSAHPVVSVAEETTQMSRKRLRSVANDSLLSLDSPKRTVVEEHDAEGALSIRLKRRRPQLKMSSDEEEEDEDGHDLDVEGVKANKDKDKGNAKSLTFRVPPRTTTRRGILLEDSDEKEDVEAEEEEEGSEEKSSANESSEDSEAPKRNQRGGRTAAREKAAVMLRVPPKRSSDRRKSTRGTAKRSYTEQESEESEEGSEEEMEEEVDSDEAKEEEEEEEDHRTGRRSSSRGRFAAIPKIAVRASRSRAKVSQQRFESEEDEEAEEEEDDDRHHARGRGSRRSAQKKTVSYKEVEEDDDEEEDSKFNRGGRSRRPSAVAKVADPPARSLPKRRTVPSSSSASAPAPVTNAYPTVTSHHRIDPEVRRQMLQVVDFASELDHKFTYFADPVDPEVAPQYYDVIQQPMDLSLIRSNIQSRRYQSVEEVIQDVLLIYANCETYNLEESQLVKEAKRQRRMFLTFAKNTFEFKP